MTRIHIYTTDEFGENRTLEGWFDTAKATCYEADREFDGNNMISVITRSQWIDEYLYRTPGGRWVLNHDSTRCNNGPDTYQFITDAEAREWLIRSGKNDDAVNELFGEIEEERGPGRPEVGKPINWRPGDDLLPRIDAHAKALGMSRADFLREIVTKAVDDLDAIGRKVDQGFDVEAGLRDIVGDDRAQEIQ